MIGSRILRELLKRGHDVAAVVRNPAKAELKGVEVKQGDLMEETSVADTAQDADAAISAYSPPAQEPGKLLDATHSLIEGLEHLGKKRLLTVGGAGGLEVAPGKLLMDTPDFPHAWKPITQAHQDALEMLKQSRLDWTTLSPAAIIEPGKRTGKYRTSENTLVTDDKNESRISAEDYAVALADELENPKHLRERFTVGY